MPDLTDEQIEGWHDWYARGWDRKKFDAWLAAVIARAKREAAEEIAADLREWADAVIGETGMRSDGATLRWAAERIGATR